LAKAAFTFEVRAVHPIRECTPLLPKHPPISSLKGGVLPPKKE